MKSKTPTQKPSKNLRDRAIGLIGRADVDKLEQAGIVLSDRASLEKLYAALRRYEEGRRD